MIDACTDDDAPNVALMWALMTDRAVLESPLGISTDTQLERSRELSEQYGESLLGTAPTAEELERLSQASTSPYSSEIVHLFDSARTIVRALPDGRVAVSFAALEDPSKATENDWLIFVAFVEVDGYYYFDEEITVLAAPSSEHGTPPPADDECA